MKAIVIEKNGGPDVLKLQDAADPVPASGQAVVRLHAAGVNFIDIYQRSGKYARALPYTPGLEGAGIVESVGPQVTNVKAGDRVAYTGQPGAYAEKSVVQADKLIPIPEGMSFEDAAAFPLQGMTAHYLLHEYYLPKPGDTVLIHAAAGGMGLLLTQWAKHLGATVFGTVSTEEKAALAKKAGADHVIIYTKQDWVEAILQQTNKEGVRLIIDGVGKTTFPGNLKAAKLRGNIVIFGSASGPADPIAPNELQQRSLTVSGGSLFNYLLSREELMKRANDVLEGIQQGWLKMHIGKVLPLAEASEAQRLLEGRETTGKLVLKT
jgi:NADPH2:quinone reductase